jgi:WD40 repeat protein
LTERFNGHTDCVWSVVYQSSSNRVISGSADTTIRLWDLGTSREDKSSDPQLKLYNAPDNAKLRSIDLNSTEPNQLLTAYSGQLAGILDLETGERILDFNLKELDEEVGEINKIISHPTMNVSAQYSFTEIDSVLSQLTNFLY